MVAPAVQKRVLEVELVRGLALEPGLGPAPEHERAEQLGHGSALRRALPGPSRTDRATGPVWECQMPQRADAAEVATLQVVCSLGVERQELAAHPQLSQVQLESRHLGPWVAAQVSWASLPLRPH